jgi:hypothetical protein
VGGSRAWLAATGLVGWSFDRPFSLARCFSYLIMFSAAMSRFKCLKTVEDSCARCALRKAGSSLHIVDRNR